MIQVFASKYALALHLALCISVPFAVYLFGAPSVAASSGFILAVLAVEWMIFAPSVKTGETLPMARVRAFFSIVTDYLFWFLVVFALFAFLGTVNSGEYKFYDMAAKTWSIKNDGVLWLPSAAENEIYSWMDIGALIAFFVAVCGVAHCIGKKGRALALVATSFIFGLIGLLAVVMAFTGSLDFINWGRGSLGSKQFIGDVFGFWFIISTSVAAVSEERGWETKGMLAMLVAVSGNAVGMVYYAPSIFALAAVAVALVVAILSILHASYNVSKMAVVRLLLIYLFSAALPAAAVLIADNDTATVDVVDWRRTAEAAKLNSFKPSAIVGQKFDEIKSKDYFMPFKELDRGESGTVDFWTTRDVFSRHAMSMWKDNPWLGVGKNAYSLNLPFYIERPDNARLKKSDWVSLPSNNFFVPNGFLQLLAERGIIGCAFILLAVMLFFLRFCIGVVISFKIAIANPDVHSVFFSAWPVVWAALLSFILILCETLVAASPVTRPFMLYSILFVLAVCSVPTSPSSK